MTIVAFFSQNASPYLQDEWQKRLKCYNDSIKLVPLLSSEAEEATRGGDCDAENCPPGDPEVLADANAPPHGR